MANGLLSHIAQGFNFDPGGAFQRGQDQARVNIQNDLTLLDRIQAQARQQQIPALFKRAASGDAEAFGRLVSLAPNAADALLRSQNIQRQREATLIKAAMGPEPTALEQQFAFFNKLSPEGQKQFAEFRGQTAPRTEVTIEGSRQISPVELARQQARFSGIKKQEEKLAERSNVAFDDLNRSAASARNAAPFLNTFEQSLLRSGQSGPITQASIPYRSFFAELGLLTDEEQSRLSDQQLAQGASKRLQLAMGEFMKGAISDNEQRIALATVPNLSNTVEGNLMIVSMLRDLSERKQRVMDLVTQDFNDARNQGRVFNAVESINRHRRELSEQEPLFNKGFMGTMLENAPNPSALLANWNRNPRFISHLKRTNVFPMFKSPTSKMARDFESNPQNVGQLVIIGNRIARITQ